MLSTTLHNNTINNTIEYLDDIDLKDIILVIVIRAVQATRPENTPRNTGQPGREYLNELL